MAFAELSNKAKVLWLYIAKNQPDYEFFLSEKDVLNFGIGSASSYDRAVKELINKGYLEKSGTNKYIFYEKKKTGV